MERRIGILLNSASPREAERVLIASLAGAADDELLHLCKALVHLNRPHGLVAAMASLPKRGEQVLRLLLAPDLRRDEAIAIARRRGGAALLGAMAVIEQACEPNLAHHAGELLESTVDDVPERAGAALLSTVTIHLGETGRRGSAAAGAASLLDRALAHALNGYLTHRNEACLLAAAIMSRRPGPRVAAILAQPDHPAVLGMRRAARRVSDPLVRRNLMGWLGVEALAPQVIRCLDQVASPVHRQEVLRDRHLLLAPRRRRALARIDRPWRCLPRRSELEAMPPQAQVGMIELMTALRTPAARQVALLGETASLPSPLVRIKGAMALAAHVSGDAMRIEESLASDGDDAVARVALTNISARLPAPRHDFLAKLEREGGATAIHFAASRLAAAGAAGFFERWLALDEWSRLEAALECLRRDRAGVIDGLRRTIAEGGRVEAIASLSLSRRLRLGDELQDEIRSRTADGDVRIASTAITQVGGHGALSVLERGLAHENQRVRANAVEAVERVPAAPVIEIVSPMARAAGNRPRANAALALLRRRRALGVERLRTMLADPDPLHRVSAIWAARRGRAVEAMWELAALAEDDPAHEVRARAASAARLLTGMQVEAAA